MPDCTGPGERPRALVTAMQKAAAAAGPANDRDYPPHGSADMARECVAEVMNRTAFYSGLACEYAAAGDDTGLGYSIRQATAALRQGIALMKHLQETKRRDAERRGGEPAAEQLRERRG